MPSPILYLFRHYQSEWAMEYLLLKQIAKTYTFW